MKFFNTSGPINPEDHYYVPRRLNDATIRKLIENKKYFILHAPRQSGKTTAVKQIITNLPRVSGKLSPLNLTNYEGR